MSQARVADGTSGQKCYGWTFRRTSGQIEKSTHNSRPKGARIPTLIHFLKVFRTETSSFSKTYKLQIPSTYTALHQEVDKAEIYTLLG
jgi:hypothetical protein